jgi:hypothetical protein
MADTDRETIQPLESLIDRLLALASQQSQQNSDLNAMVRGW